VILKKSVVLGLGSFLILALSACGDAGVKVAEERSGKPNTGVAADAPGPTTAAVAGGATREDGQPEQSGENADMATIDSLVGFFVTESEGQVKDYAGITADGLLTDYTYNDTASCYDPTTTQIIERGMGIFWVEDGDIITELRLAQQNGNLVLFRDDIAEEGRVVYPGTSTVSLADLQMCG